MARRFANPHFSERMLGFVLVLTGSLCLALQNVLVRLAFVKNPIFGVFSWGGFLAPSVANSLLLLQMRAVLMAVMMMAIAPKAYPNTRESLEQLITPAKRPLLLRTVASSVFMALALGFLFIALGQIPAGIATVLFFTHPAITVLLSWKFFGDRPTALRLAVVVAVFTGSFLIAPNFSTTPTSNTILGVLAALAAGICYSLQGILAQTCVGEIHPVPFTLVTFIVASLITSLSLFAIEIKISSDLWLTLWILCAVTALLTLAGQLFYNLGIRLSSAALVGIIGISNPTLTALLAWLIIQEALQGKQIFGVLLVILGIATLGLEKRFKKVKESS